MATAKDTFTKDVITRLKNAQFAYTRDILHDALQLTSYGDDYHDGLKGALNLSVEMMEIDIDDDIDRLKTLLEPGGLDDYSCDGVCPAISELAEDDDE